MSCRPQGDFLIFVKVHSMNKSYKSVWNESTGSWVAVSELATGRSKSKRAKTAISKAILTQIAVGGMGLAGASIAMAGDPIKLGTGATVNVADGVAIGTDAEVDADMGPNAGKAYSGIAAATALTMIPDVDANKTLSIGIGGGTFQGYAATAIGGTARITQNIKVRVGAGWSAAGTTVGAGASYQW
jgi:autotransporter adhesin